MNDNNFYRVIGMAFTILAFIMVQFSATAQDEITDDEINNYISVMAQIDTLKVQMKTKTNDLVKDNELMDMGRVFNAIKGAEGDSLALATLDVTPEQMAAYTEINQQIDRMTDEFKEAYTRLIKDDLGASTYNKIKKGLGADKVLQGRYDAALKNYKSTLATENP